MFKWIKSNWRLAAMSLLAAGIISTAALEQGKQPYRSEHAQNHEPNTQPAIAAVAHPKTHAAADTQHGDEKHDAAPWIKWLENFLLEINIADSIIAAFTVVLAVSTIGLWRETERLAKHAESEAKAANQRFEDQRRPWIQLRPEIAESWSRVTENRRHGVVNINLNLKNVGLSPAFDVFVENSMEGIRVHGAEQRDLDRVLMAKVKEAPHERGVAMFPGEEREEGRVMSFDLPGKPDAHAVNWHGFIAYRFAPDGAFHFTPFILQVKWRQMAGEEPRVPMKLFRPRQFNLPPT